MAPCLMLSSDRRPKANVREGNTLWPANFTSVQDQQPIEQVEVATRRLARICDIRTPEVRLELAASPFPVALIERFDRRRGQLAITAFEPSRRAVFEREMLRLLQ